MCFFENVALESFALLSSFLKVFEQVDFEHGYFIYTWFKGGKVMPNIFCKYDSKFIFRDGVWGSHHYMM